MKICKFCPGFALIFMFKFRHGNNRQEILEDLLHFSTAQCQQYLPALVQNVFMVCFCGVSLKIHTYLSVVSADDSCK